MSRKSDHGNLNSSEVATSSADSKIVPKTKMKSKCQEDRTTALTNEKTKLKQDQVNKDITNKGSSSKDVSSPLTNRITRQSILKQEVYKQRERFLSMDLESKRKLYKNKHTTLEEIKTWPEYYKEIHKGSQKTGKQEKINDADEHFEVREDLNQKVSIFQGDITTLEIDAIVNAANESLLGGGGVDGAIHRAAGSNLVAECEILDGCVTGDAKITCGYKLPAKYVIHAVGPRGENPKVLRRCYIRCLELLKKHNLKTIAFPCISTGIFGYPNTRAARVVLETLREWLETDEYAAQVERIILCLFLKVDVDIYKKFMQVYFPVGSCTLTDVNENSSTESKQEESSPGQSDKTSDNEEETAPHKDES